MKPLLLALFCALPLLACGNTTAGQACASDADCDPGQSCNLTLPGGFCQKTCAIAGSVRDCPSGTVCASHGDALVCSAICKAQTDCRTDYECNGVSGSADKACTPKAN